MLIKEIFLPQVLHDNISWLKKRQINIIYFRNNRTGLSEGYRGNSIPSPGCSVLSPWTATALSLSPPSSVPPQCKMGTFLKFQEKKNHLHFIWGRLPYALRSTTQKPSEFPRVGVTPEEKQNPHTHLKPTLWLLLMGDNFILLGITKLCTIRNSTL